ncbi:MAG: transposase [Limnospira sp. PMC 1291.21]|uniref:Transposase n=3 Tax=Limnospira TaxID=2596745 RepID=A0A9P1KEW6_9CYAN|nr:MULTISPECIES: hypothetical protein [Limnospira]EKD06390.1 putative transposase [Arthrospira platensis C1]MDC0837854.1 transposase [Limnoraphis robusta]MDY7051856.1 transposase [Limnospira fusiformis LS22]MDT9180473.1 transposase [Limnospira sp. PMC 1238.20]MDT9190633.1 transposase [Limnospira sp. PMC 894.15]
MLKLRIRSPLKMPLKVREWECPDWETDHDRDRRKRQDQHLSCLAGGVGLGGDPKTRTQPELREWCSKPQRGKEPETQIVRFGNPLPVTGRMSM